MLFPKQIIELPVAKALHVVWTVLHIDVRTHLLLRFHEAQIPVRNAMLVQPLDRLTYGEAVEVADAEAMSDYPNPRSLVREEP